MSEEARFEFVPPPAMHQLSTQLGDIFVDAMRAAGHEVRYLHGVAQVFVACLADGSEISITAMNVRAVPRTCSCPGAPAPCGAHPVTRDAVVEVEHALAHRAAAHWHRHLTTLKEDA